MAYSLETSSVKTIVPGAEVSGFADVVARQAIENLPTLSGGEGIQIVNEDGKNRIDLGLSAGSNMSLVYDQETNTIRLDAEGGGATYTGVAPIQVNNTTNEISISGETLSAGPGINIFESAGYVVISAEGGTTYTGDAQGALDNVYTNSAKYILNNANSVGIGGSQATANGFAQGGNNVAQSYSIAQGLFNSAIGYSIAQGQFCTAYSNSIAQGATNSAAGVSQAFGSHTIANNSGMAIGNYNNITTGAFVIGNGSAATARNDCFIIDHNGNVSAAGKISANGVELGAGGGSTFPITGTNGTTGFTANMNCSSFTVSTGAGAAGAYIQQSTQGVKYEAYPATDVSASWLEIIRAANNLNITCSAVKLTTGANEVRFETSALPNLNKITFIAPNYGPYGTYSALISDGDTTFVSEVDSGCCRTVVKCWNDDRNKDCWCGLNQESYFYIG